MNDYKTFTNSELEDEIERVKKEYEAAQKLTIENYQLMLEFAAMYGMAKEVLDIRMGKKKEG